MIPVRATMVNMAANEARDVQAQYGRDDIIDDVAVTLRNHTEDEVEDNRNAQTTLSPYRRYHPLPTICDGQFNGLSGSI